MEWFPHYIDDYDADTMLLSAAEDGIYHRLLRWYYRNERPLPADDETLAHIARVDLSAWMAAAAKIKPMFKLNGAAVMHHKRCDQVLLAQVRKRKDGAKRSKRLRERGIHDAKRVTNA